MAILKTYNNEGVVGLVGDDRPARIFCHKCGAILGSSEYEPRKKSLCACCTEGGGGEEKSLAQICARVTGCFNQKNVPPGRPAAIKKEN